MATSMPILAQITDAFKFVGMIAFFPGLGLIARDLVLYIWDQVAVKRERERMLGGAKIRDKAESGSMMAVHCWDTNICRESTREQCLAYKKRKTCWKLRTGCFCDEGGVLRQNLLYEDLRASKTGTIPTAQKALSDKLKAARCRKCTIYNEHQRLKYTIAVPLVFIFVIVGGYYFYPTLTTTINNLAYQADKFMSYLTTHPGVPNYDPKVDGVIITTFVLAWIGITLVSYLLKFVEYIFFELKV